MKFGWLLGLIQKNFSWKLDPEENLETPVALVTYSDKGLTWYQSWKVRILYYNIMSSKFSKKERPILINNWEATYFDFQGENC